MRITIAKVRHLPSNQQYQCYAVGHIDPEEMSRHLCDWLWRKYKMTCQDDFDAFMAQWGWDKVEVTEQEVDNLSRVRLPHWRAGAK